MKTYILKYREPGKRPNSLRWAKRDVDTVEEAKAFLDSTPDAFGPAFVLTRGWNPSTVAILRA